MVKIINNQILRISQFVGSSDGDGGARRTLQIQELVAQAGLEICEIKSIPTFRWERYISGINFLAKYRSEFPFLPQIISKCGHQYIAHQNFLKRHTGTKTIIWEETKNYITPYVAREYGFNVIAIPQNIESLVSGAIDPLTGQNLPESFENEVKYLKKADFVFSISREEQWLLKLRGIDADFLPYYPPQKILLNLREIREIRKTSKKNKFLILGTASNPPTRIGMIEQLHLFNRIAKKINFEVDIAGYGTECLKEYCSHPEFTLHGTVSSEQLNLLLINCKAVMVHQKAGVGALTRIPEMIIAGIPVISNSNACRSAFNYPGVHCYDSEVELAELISKYLDMPNILERPIEAENRFINCVKELSIKNFTAGKI